MSVNVLLSTIILISFIVTLILAVGSYMAYKVRDRRRPMATSYGDGDGPVFFERFFPSRPATGSEAPGAEQRGV
jgi:hypothetical protein